MKRVLSRMLVASSLMLGVSLAMPSFGAEGPAAPDADRGANLFEQGDAARGIIACASCHGVAGDSTLEANPKLAGQSAGYIRKQLIDLRATDNEPPTRVSVIMNPLAAPLTDQDIADIAIYIEQQTLENPATASNPDLVDLGQKIWRGGIPSKQVPACAACHGAHGGGIPEQYPYLGGQFASYIRDQLIAFRSGERGNNEAMYDIAVRLSDPEIEAVSDYAAGLR